MSVVGLYGTVPFMTGGRLTQTFHDLRSTYRASFAEHNVHLQKSVLEYTGPGLIEVQFSMNLSTRWHLNPNLLLAQLLRYQGPPAQAAMLFLGGQLLGRGLSLYVLEECGVQHKFFDRMGVMIGAEVEVKMKEYGAMSSLYGGRI